MTHSLGTYDECLHGGLVPFLANNNSAITFACLSTRVLLACYLFIATTCLSQVRERYTTAARLV
jgi:hypothetical protein